MGNTSSKSKPSSASKVKRRLTAAPKSYYDYEMPMPHGYYPSAAEYYGHPQAIPPYANPPAPQYPYFYPGPHAMPEPQPFIPPPPVRRVPPPQISDPPAPQPLAPATQPYAQNTTRSAAVQPVTQPVIPPAPQRERTRQKRTTTRKKPKPKPIIVYDPPEPTQDADIPRSLPGASTPQRGNSTPQPPASSPSHARRSTTNTAHSTPQTHHTSSPATTSRSYERPPNPLPPPPVDIFATTPYRHLLELKPEPEIPGITYFAPGQQFIVRQEGPPKEKEKKGLFGMMKKSPPQTIRETIVILGQPASPTSAAPPPASATSNVNPPPTTATTAPTPATHDTGFQQPSPPPGSSAQSYFQGQSQSHGSDSGHSHPPAAPAATAIFFNQDTEYSAFLNHAPYSVSYERVRYPTATHLLEALKFLPGDQERQNIAELIRTREDTADVYRIAHEYRECQNEDYRESYMQKMEMVMFLKFSQHGELKDLLLETGEAPLVYDDPSDSFWGIGQQADGQPGQNELGVILERIRRRFHQAKMR